MINLIYVGAGGFFSEIYEYINHDINMGYLSGIEVIGVLDDRADLVNCDLKLLGTVDEHKVDPSCHYLITVGNPKFREIIFEKLSIKGARFFTYIHSSCYIAKTAKVEEGVVLCPFSIVNSNAKVGSNVAINVHCSVGHDSQVGRSSVLSPYCAVNGNSSVGNESFLGTRASIFPGVNIGKRTQIDAHSYAKCDVIDNSIVTVRGEYKVFKNKLI
ncbi:acetyltransferase [Aliikangiella sp. IMCC44653]